MAGMSGALVSRVLVDGAAVIFDMDGQGLPSTVWVNPVAGDTVAVSASVDNGVTYLDWPAGAVTTYTDDILESGVTHLKVQRTAGAGTTSAWGIS